GIRDFHVTGVQTCALPILNFNIYIEDMSTAAEPSQNEPASLEEEDLLKLLDYIPEGCRTVFNLFAIEGYSHKEIAAMLNITEGRSEERSVGKECKVQSTQQ